MKEEKRKSMLTLILPSKNQPHRVSAKKINDTTQNAKYKDTCEQSQTKQKFARAVRLVGTKPTILSFHAQVRENGIQTSHPNQIKAQCNKSQADKQNMQVREMRKKLKRVGKKVWVTAYKQSIDQEDLIVQQPDLAVNLKTSHESSKDEYKQFKQRGNSAKQNNRIVELMRAKDRADQKLLQINKINQQQSKVQQQEDAAIKTREHSKLQANKEEHESEHSQTHSINIENFQPRKQELCSINDNNGATEQLPQIDIDKMLQEIQNDHTGLKCHQPSINQEIKSFGINSIQTEPCKIEQKLTTYRDDCSSFSKETPRQNNQPALSRQGINSRQLLKRGEYSRSYQSFTRNNGLVKKQSLPQEIDMKMTYSRFPRKNSRKLLPPSQHKEQKESEQMKSSQKPKVFMRLKKQSSLNSISSTVMTNSRVQLDKVKLRECKQKQIQPSNSIPITQSLHMSQKKETRKLGVQKFKNSETEEHKITSSLKKNVKNFEINRLIAQARKEIVPQSIFV